MDDLLLTKKAEAYVAAATSSVTEQVSDSLLVPLTNRKAIADSIERLIDMLDAMSPDPDLEPYLGYGDDREGDLSDWEPDHDNEEGADSEFSLGWSEGQSQTGSLAGGSYGHEGDLEPDLGWTHSERLGRYKSSWITDGEEDAGDDREMENEHGGNVTDEPHDAQDEGDYEPTLGWGNRTGQSGVGLEDWNGIDATDSSPVGGGGPLGFTGDGYAEGKAALRELKRKRPDKPQAYVKTSAGLAMEWWKSGEVGTTRIPTDSPDWLAHYRAAKGL